MSGPNSTPKSPPPAGKEPPPSGSGPGPGSGGIRFPRWVWTAIFVGLLVWNAFLIFAPMSEPSVDIPYSVFLAQAKANNVAQVTLTGQAVDGTFRAAIQYPPVAPSSSPTASAAAPAASTTAAAAPAPYRM